MSTPKPTQPERQPPVAAAKPPTSPPVETKRPTDSVPMQAGSFAKLPLRFGRYQVEKLLGKGAMGAVYLARDTQLDRLVALKIPILSAKSSEKLLKRLKTEAMAAAQIDHPSVCPVHDSGDIDGIPYICMQYVEGETLKDHLKNQAKTPQEAVTMISQLAEGLAEAHSRKIYHRDLKPENIKLNRRGVPVIMDFGLAKLATTFRSDASATQAGTTLGTPAYMSPEQASGKVEEIDHRSDIYALGVMLYEMLTGTWPFTGAALQVMGQKSVLEPPSPLTVKPELNPQLAAVCQKLIAKKREDRYQTAQEVITALALIDFGGPPSAAGTQPPFGSSTDAGITDFLKEIAVGSPKSVPPKKAPAPWFGKGKKKHLLIGGGILGVLALLAGLVISFRTKEGTLVVTVNEPDAEVLVLSEAGKVEIKQRGEKGPITISVDPGKHRLKVQKDGFEFFSKDFEIASGGKTSITAKLVPDKPAVHAKGWQDWPADAPTPAIAPFNAELAKEHQAAWSKYLEVPVEYTNSLGMKFVLVPPGAFTMGSTPAEIEEALKFVGDDKHWQDSIRSEAPQHKAILTQPIYLGINEVTQEQYERVMGKNPSHFAPTGAGKAAVGGLNTTSQPVEMVSWNDAAEFCTKLSQQEKLRPFYFRSGETVTVLDGGGYRLPTEAEWEFACRAGTTTKYWTGDKDEDVQQVGWTATNSGGRSHAVGEMKPNPFGLHDIHGNIWEWVQDWWDPNYYAQFQAKPALDPSGPFSADSRRVLRGGFWGRAASNCRASARYADVPTNRDLIIGFRVSRMAGTVKTGEATKPVAMLNDPAFQKWMKEVAGMPAKKQVEAVARKLQELNPGFDGKVTDWDGKGTPKIENGVVTTIGFLTDNVTDISPVRALSQLKDLWCISSTKHGRLSDLSPLKGMKLVYFYCLNTQVSDLSPLGNGMPLQDMHFGNTPVFDLSPLRGMPLEKIHFAHTAVSDLSPLKGMPLLCLDCPGTQVSNLSPLQGMKLTAFDGRGTNVSDLSPIKDMPLKELWLDFQPDRDTELLSAPSRLCRRSTGKRQPSSGRRSSRLNRRERGPDQPMPGEPARQAQFGHPRNCRNSGNRLSGTDHPSAFTSERCRIRQNSFSLRLATDYHVVVPTRVSCNSPA